MPTMIRVDKKAEKIAHKIIGVPINMQPPKKKKSWTERRLIFEETQRVR
jgi:hypothetical protein